MKVNAISLSCIVALCIAFFCLAGAETASAAGDSTAPEITSISIANASALKAKGNAVVTVGIVETGSGVNNITLGFVNDSGDYKAIGWQNLGEGEKPLFSGTHKLTIPLENKFANGEYRLCQLAVGDSNGNDRFYDENEITAAGLDTTINITGSTADLTAPVINDFRILNADAVDATGKIEVEFDITEDGSGVRVIYMTFRNEFGHEAYVSWEYEWDYRTPIKTGTKVLKQDADVFGNGRYKLEAVGMYDLGGNQCALYPDDFGNVEITVFNSTTDVSPPEIVSLNLNTHEVVTPDVLDFDLEFTDENYATMMGFVFEDESGRLLEIPYGGDREGWRLEPGSYEHLQVPLDPFMREGNYTLTNVYINDNNGRREYWAGDLISADEDRKLKLSSAFSIADYGSLDNVDGLYEQISNLGEGQTLVLDARYTTIAPDWLFYTIAGQDKTIVFQTDEVQWVFNGMSIYPENCKDIDVEVLIRSMPGISMGFPDEDQVAAVIFKDNGDLPGPADIRINYNYLTARFIDTEGSPVFSFAEENSLPQVVDEEMEIQKDNAAVTTIDHNSTYVMSGKMPRVAKLTGAAPAKEYTYTGKSIKAAVKVQAEGKAASSSGYTVSYKNNKNVGKATFTVKGKGIYEGSITKTFTINPKGTSLKTVKKAKKAINVSWKKQAQKMSKSRVTGYQIELANNKSFSKGKKLVTVKGYNKVSRKVTGLKKGKKYYVHVRTFMKVGGKKYYSPWSKVKTAVPY